MCSMLAPDLHAARLVLRFVDAGQPYIGNLLRPASLPLGSDVEAILAALWDREDRRPTAQRLCAPGVPDDPALLDFLLGKLVASGLVVATDFDEQAAWLAKLELELPPLPLVDQVELTNACPLTCCFCPRGLGKMRRPVGHMDLGLLAEIVDQVKHLHQRKPFGLHHFGESLLHPDPVGAVRVVAQAGLQPELSVNPVLLKDEMADRLLEAGVGVLIVSLDGLDTETLQRMRGPVAGRFEQVERVVERLIDRAAQRPEPPTVMISMVATRHNQHQWSELFRRYRRPEQPWLTPVVRLLEDFGDADIVPLSVHPLRQLCGSPYMFVSVLWDGSVVPCCHDFDGAIVYGNLHRQSLEEIWRSEVVARFRQRWQRLEFADHEPCARCAWRVDRYRTAANIALTDAWTPVDWPALPPPRSAPGRCGGH